MGRTVIGKRDIQPERVATAADFEFEMAEKSEPVDRSLRSIDDHEEETPVAPSDDPASDLAGAGGAPGGIPR